MSTLKQLRLRINGVKSTQKITKTMKMVAASKLLKAQEQKENAQPYADKMYSMIASLSESVSVSNEAINLLKGNGKDNINLLVAVGSDRGLCGGFNANIAKKVKSQVKIFNAQGKNYKIICIGKKVFDQIKHLYRGSVIQTIPSMSNKKISYVEAQELAIKLTTLFNLNEFDTCTFIYNEFKSALKQSVSTRRLIPFDMEAISKEKKETEKHVFEYEPSESKVLEQIIPLNLAVQIYYILLESSASEHGARTTAMDSATNNAKDMITKLTLLYNRSRQAAITKELIEIISSAEVV